LTRIPAVVFGAIINTGGSFWADAPASIASNTLQPIDGLPITSLRKYRPRAGLAVSVPQLVGFAEMSEGDFKLQLENATLRRLLEHAATDAVRRDSAEKLQRLILEELHHRVKNTLAIVQSITTQSVRTAIDLPHAGEAISARLGALGRVHDLLLRTSWAGAMLPELLKTAIEPFETPGREQFRIQPTPIRINPAAALPFVMTINELCTNASKHGALTVPNGRVNITTKVNERAGTFHFNWSEKGGPIVGEPSRRSFGMFLIEKGFAEQFSGSTRMQFKPSGVVCEIDVPLVAIQQQISN
jgi:two-component sensor histidine kinase